MVRPLFHYAYRQEGVILDQQYNYQGNLLAACNSNGEILFFSAESEEQHREPVYSTDRKRSSDRRNAAILRIAWSLPIFGYFASASISREIDLFTCSKSSIAELVCRKMEYIPLALAFCPVETDPLLAVGLSDGSIVLLNEQLQEVAAVSAHEEAVNCLAWDHRILAFEKNKWIAANFSHVRKPSGLDDPPLLVSGSSDASLKLWRWEGGRLSELQRIRGHQRAVRDVQWRSTYLFDCDRFVISCSEVLPPDSGRHRLHLETQKQLALAQGDAAVRRPRLQGQLQLSGQDGRSQLLQRRGGARGDGDNAREERGADGRGHQILLLICVRLKDTR